MSEAEMKNYLYIATPERWRLATILNPFILPKEKKQLNFQVKYCRILNQLLLIHERGSKKLGKAPKLQWARQLIQFVATQL